MQNGDFYELSKDYHSRNAERDLAHASNLGEQELWSEGMPWPEVEPAQSQEAGT